MKVLLCDPDLVWSKQMISDMKLYGICAEMVEEPSELWSGQAAVQGIIVNLQELESMLFWGAVSPKASEDARDEMAAIRSLCIQGKKVVLVLPKVNYQTECACLKAGAVECIYKEQPMDLIMQRLLRVFHAEMQQDMLWFGGVCFDRTEGNLVFQEHAVRLTGMEQSIVAVLFQRGTALTGKHYLLKLLWGEQEIIQKHRLDTLIKNIRRKMQKFPICICTRYGQGYYLGMVDCKKEADLSEGED